MSMNSNSIIILKSSSSLNRYTIISIYIYKLSITYLLILVSCIVNNFPIHAHVYFNYIFVYSYIYSYISPKKQRIFFNQLWRKHKKVAPKFSFFRFITKYTVTSLDDFSFQILSTSSEGNTVFSLTSKKDTTTCRMNSHTLTSEIHFN